MNPFLIELLGFSRETFLGKAIWELGFFKDILANQDSFAELQQKQYIRYEDKPLKAADGRLIDVEFVSNVYLVDHQKVIQCNIRDITERKRTASLLREKETNFRLLAENIRDVFWLSTPTVDRIIYVSPAYVQVWGRTCESLYQRPQSFVEAIHPEDQSRVIAALQEHAQGNWNIEYRIIRPDGAVRWILDRGYPVHDEHGELIHMCGIARDISDSKQSEDAVRASEARLRAFCAAMPDVGLLLDEDGRYVEVLTASDHLLYKQAVNLVGRTVPEVFPADQAALFMGLIRRTLETGKVQTIEYSMSLEIGQTWFETSSAPVTSIKPAKRMVVILARDITARKQAEAEHNELQAQLLQSQKLESIGTLAGGVAHEINNPIMGIMNYAQLIVDQLGPDSPATEYATEIGKETQRVGTIVRNLLSFARQDKETHRSPARLCDIVEDTLSLVRAVMRHDQITLEVNVPADLTKILCRSQQIRQVIMNLLTNARDALNQKYPGHDENKKVIISAREVVIGEQSSMTASEKRWVRLTVEDHGTGIPDAVRECMFDPFYTTKKPDKGTGLGLSISHGIVKDHGGELSVESEVGQWTRSHVDLPIE